MMKSLDHFFQKYISEISMTPGSLERETNDQSTVGVEFEMLVPVSILGEYNEPLADRWVTSLDSIEEFFSASNRPESVVETATDLYTTAIKETLPENWRQDRDKIRTTAIKDWFEQEIFLGMSGGVEVPAGESRTQYIRKFHQDAFDLYTPGQEEIGSMAYKWYVNQMSEQPQLLEALIRQFCPRMKDVWERGRTHGLRWPTEGSTDDSQNRMSDLTDIISDVVGEEARWSMRYHGAKRGDRWIVEPDRTVASDDPGYMGAEIVSPPRPINETLASITKIYRWAHKVGAKTIPPGGEYSTGLHVNVSVPNQGQVNYLKLVLMLGDRYILKTFGREYSEYARSAFDILKEYALDPEKAQKLAPALINKLEIKAQSIITDELQIGKHVSINPKDGYFEFRGPGGDWLNQPLDVLTNTVRRIARAMEVSSTDQYHREYLKKLYMFLSDGLNSDTDMVDWFINSSVDRDPDLTPGDLLRINQTRRANKGKK